MQKTKKKVSELGDMGDRMYTGQPYAQGGALGSVGLDTISSPDISQTPEKFKYPQTAASASDISTPPPDDYASTFPTKDRQDFEADVDAIKDVVTPDEVLAGMQYVLKKMVFKRKDVAKQIVVQCLKKDPKYFSSLRMLNINDDPEITEMLRESYYTPQEKEIALIMRQMHKNKQNKRNYNSI
jgi:hypothetical protein